MSKSAGIGGVSTWCRAIVRWRCSPCGGGCRRSWSSTTAVLRGEPCRTGGLDDAVRGAEIVVRFRGDDASWMHPVHVRGHSLKKRFQELGIPPWERGRIPLTYAGDVLAAIGSEWLNPRLRAAPWYAGVARGVDAAAGCLVFDSILRGTRVKVE